jgi:hypothetical protein
MFRARYVARAFVKLRELLASNKDFVQKRHGWSARSSHLISGSSAKWR